jgi:hypothetical protein
VSKYSDVRTGPVEQGWIDEGWTNVVRWRREKGAREAGTRGTLTTDGWGNLSNGQIKSNNVASAARAQAAAQQPLQLLLAFAGADEAAVELQLIASLRWKKTRDHSK